MPATCTTNILSWGRHLTALVLHLSLACCHENVLPCDFKDKGLPFASHFESRHLKQRWRLVRMACCCVHGSTHTAVNGYDVLTELQGASSRVQGLADGQVAKGDRSSRRQYCDSKMQDSFRGRRWCVCWTDRGLENGWMSNFGLQSFWGGCYWSEVLSGFVSRLCVALQLENPFALNRNLNIHSARHKHWFPWERICLNHVMFY